MRTSIEALVLVFSIGIACEARAATCDFGDLVLCPKYCASGDLESCYFHARALSSGNRIAQDRAASEKMFRELCDKGHGDSCNALAHGVLGERTDGVHIDEQFLAAQPYFEKGCELGSSKACNNMGSFLRRNLLGRRAESQEFFIRSCTLGRGQASVGCSEAAKSFRDGTFGNAKDPARAAELFKRGCLLGATAQCAQATALGLSVTLSATELSKVNAESCRQGDLVACASHGYALSSGRGLGKNAQEAARIFEIVCGGDVQEAYGCSEVARLRLSGDLKGGVDVVGAVAPARKACELERAEACRTLADLVVMGQGLPANRAEAKTLYEKACALKAPQGCHQAGALSRLAANATSEAVAQALFAEGCRGGDEDSCTALKRSESVPLLKGAGKVLKSLEDDSECETRGVPHACFDVGLRLEKSGDRTRARRSFEIACQGGVPRACTAVSKYATAGWGGPKDEDASLEALARACVLGHGQACMPAKARVVSTKSPGRFTPAALVRARKDLEDGCRAGVVGACFTD